jgi:hypothetical protein
MQFADAQATSTAYLILRHLYDGDVIEWPIEEDHPLRDIFLGLEAQGYVVRWDRVWPLHDRYRLTDRGIAAIEAVYKPAGADAFFEEMRGLNMTPERRRAYLLSHRLDPVLWPVLHDPSTHWSNYGTTPSPYYFYVWQDQQPVRRRRPPARDSSTSSDDDIDDDAGIDIGMVTGPRPQQGSQLVDLDREADDAGGGVAAGTTDYDVS